jgi:hypothetical protein
MNALKSKEATAMTKRSIYGMTPEAYAGKLKKKLIFDLALAGGTLLLNILLALFRNDQTHIWFMLINIFTDIACGLYLVFDLSVNYAPRLRLWKLRNRPMERISGQITEIEAFTTRYASLDCYCVRLEKRRTFLPVDTLQLEVGSQVELTLSGNVIVEVTQ